MKTNKQVRLFQRNMTKQKQKNIYIKKKIKIAIAKRKKKLKIFETRLNAKKELIRIKKASLILLYILST